MSKIYLNLSIMVESDESLDTTIEAITEDLNYFLGDNHNGGVIHCTWDREAALASNKANLAKEKAILDLQREQAMEESEQVATVMARYNIQLPRLKQGQPEWRVPTGPCYGQSRGLNNLRGELILTNGVMAILIIGYSGAGERAKWVQIHYENFIADKPEHLPLPQSQPKERPSKADVKFWECLEGF